MAATTSTVTVPASSAGVILDPGTAYSVTVVNTGTVRVFVHWFAFAANSGWNGDYMNDPGSRVAPGEHLVVYPQGPVFCQTDLGTAGQVTVTTYPLS